MKIYKILDNGGYPFIIENYNEDNYIIVKHNNELGKIIYKSHYVKKLIGKSQNIKNNGNSMLYLIDVNKTNTKFKYLYIGSEIYLFTTDEAITKFYSPIGNSSVPYPYAKNKYETFIMLDKCIIDNDLIKNVKDPYSYYYKIIMDKKNKTKFNKFKSLKNITK